MQCNAKYVECFSAQKDCNKEKNRNSSVVPCKIASSGLIATLHEFFLLSTGLSLCLEMKVLGWIVISY